MTAARVVAEVTFASSAAATQWSVTWPSVVDPDDPDDPGPRRGDVLLIFPGSGYETNGPVVDTGTGDLIQFSHAFQRETGTTTNDCAAGCFYKRANGDEAATTTACAVSSGDPGRTAHGYVIRGADEYTAPDLTYLRQTSAATNPDPPSHTAAWGSADNLWFAHCSGAGTSGITGGPTGFSTPVLLSGVAVTGPCRSASCWKQDTTDTLDPSAFTRASAKYIATSCAIRPAQSVDAARLARFQVFQTDDTFPNDIPVTVEGGHENTVLVAAVSGATLTPGTTTLMLDPGGLDITLAPCSNGVTTSGQAGTSTTLQLFRVPDASLVPPGAYTLRGSRTSGSGSWGVHWVELYDCADEVDVVNVVGSPGTGSNVSGNITGTAGGIALALVHEGAVSDLTLNRIAGVAPMGLGETAGSADSRHSNLFIGRVAAGSNAYLFDEGGTISTTVAATIVTFGYVAPTLDDDNCFHHAA